MPAERIGDRVKDLGCRTKSKRHHGVNENLPSPLRVAGPEGALESAYYSISTFANSTPGPNWAAAAAISSTEM